MKPTLIIVDDVQAVREKLRDSLEDEFEILGLAASGAEAIEMCRDSRPQLVLMDLVMPKMSGIDATRAIMSDGEPPRIVVLSALGDDNIVLRALEAGAAEYLIKPISESKIREALRIVASEAA